MSSKKKKIMSLIKTVMLSASMLMMSLNANASEQGSEIVGKIKNLVISEESITFNLDTNQGYAIRTQKCDEAPELTFVIYTYGGSYSKNLASFVLSSYSKDQKIMVIGNGDCYIDDIYQQETIQQISEA